MTQKEFIEKCKIRAKEELAKQKANPQPKVVVAQPVQPQKPVKKNHNFFKK